MIMKNNSKFSAKKDDFFILQKQHERNLRKNNIKSECVHLPDLQKGLLVF